MGLNSDYIDGQTPLNEEEQNGLLIPSITTREELDSVRGDELPGCGLNPHPGIKNNFFYL
jgi:hypothetical protein